MANRRSWSEQEASGLASHGKNLSWTGNNLSWTGGDLLVTMTSVKACIMMAAKLCNLRGVRATALDKSHAVKLLEVATRNGFLVRTAVTKALSRQICEVGTKRDRNTGRDDYACSTQPPITAPAPSPSIFEVTPYV